MQIPLPLPVIVRKRRAGVNKEESRQFRILLPATWSRISSVRVALKLLCLFKDSLLGGFSMSTPPCPPNSSNKCCSKTSATDKYSLSSAAVPPFCFSLFLLQAVRAVSGLSRWCKGILSGSSREEPDVQRPVYTVHGHQAHFGLREGSDEQLCLLGSRVSIS